MTPVQFEFDRAKTLAVLAYLASKKIPGLDKYKTCKLLFLSDKRHLVRYGRTITGDAYFALSWGPVPSGTLDALNDDDPLAEDIAEIFTVAQNKYRRYTLRKQKRSEAKKLIGERLAESETEVLNEIINQHGKKTFDELFKITHATPAYYKAWARRGYMKSWLMDFDEFFEGDADALEGTREAMHEEALLSQFLERR